MRPVELRPERIDHVPHQVAPEVQHLRVRACQGQRKGALPGGRVPVVVQRGHDLPLRGLVVRAGDDAARLPAFQVDEDVHQAHIRGAGPGPVDLAALPLTSVDQEPRLLQHPRDVHGRGPDGGPAVVGDDQEDGLLVRQAHQPPDHPVDGGVGPGHSLPAAPEGRGVRSAGPVHVPHPEVVRVVRGVGLHHEQVPLPRPRQVAGHVRDALVVKLQELKVGVVVDQAEGVPRRVLEEVPDAPVDLAGHALRVGVAVRGPDLRDEQLEHVRVGRQRDQFHADVAPHPRPVDLEAVQPPVAPLPRAQVGHGPVSVPGPADAHAVVASSGGVDQAVERLRRSLLAPLHVPPAPRQRADGQHDLPGRTAGPGEAPPSLSGVDAHGVDLPHGLEGARVEGLRVALSPEGAGRPFAPHEEVVARHLMVVGDAGAGPLHLHPPPDRGRPGHLPLHQDGCPARPLEGVPEVLRLREPGVDAPDGLVQPAAQSPDVEVHHPVRARPGAGGQGRPAGRGEGGKHAHHRPPDAPSHERRDMGRMALVGHVFDEFHAGAVHPHDDGAPGGGVQGTPPCVRFGSRGERSDLQYIR